MDAKIAFAAMVTGLCLAWPAFAEEIPLYERLDPSAHSYAAAEAQRQDAVRRQVQLNDVMRWRAGFPPANGVFYYPLPPSLEYAYATGRLGSLDYGPPDPWVGDDIFTPWPYVPGDIWGFRFAPTVRQPVGRIELQTGPNRWESRPVYVEPAAPGGPREF